MKLSCIICSLLTAWLLLMSNYATATDFNLKLGGVMHEPTLISKKFVSLSYEHPFTSLFDYRLEGGILQNNLPEPLTGFISPSIGLSIKGEGAYAKVFFGPALVTYTDQNLNTSFQFNTDFEVGLRDKRGVELGIGFKHFSNGGITQPNYGRDILYFKVGF